MVEADGYVLRISTEEWVKEVFDLAIYYTSISRKWSIGQMIIFVHKTSLGDAVIGYGEIGHVPALDDLPEDEKLKCEKWGWKRAIEFKYVVRFEKPLVVRETPLKNLNIRGRYLHGFPLNKQQLNLIIKQAERLQPQSDSTSR
jgi:hypothetical protein